MTSLVLSVAAGLLTAALATVWALAVAGEMGDAARTAPTARDDLRTW